jgi:hypothetical protein
VLEASFLRLSGCDRVTGERKVLVRTIFDAGVIQGCPEIVFRMSRVPNSQLSREPINLMERELRSPLTLSLVPDVWPRILHEATTVRHLHFGQTLGIHNLAIPDDAIEVQNVRHHCVDFRWL